jgi:hypothetical protein
MRQSRSLWTRRCPHDRDGHSWHFAAKPNRTGIALRFQIAEQDIEPVERSGLSANFPFGARTILCLNPSFSANDDSEITNNLVAFSMLPSLPKSAWAEVVLKIQTSA